MSGLGSFLRLTNFGTDAAVALVHTVCILVIPAKAGIQAPLPMTNQPAQVRNPSGFRLALRLAGMTLDYPTQGILNQALPHP
jgi:hypothetical protein